MGLLSSYTSDNAMGALWYKVEGSRLSDRSRVQSLLGAYILGQGVLSTFVQLDHVSTQV